jgi:glycosyltransferase involved in cell wall biosynthesis
LAESKLTIYQWETNSVCSNYRLIFPGNAIGRFDGVEVKLLKNFGQVEFSEILENGDIFIIQRMFMMNNLDQIIFALRKKGVSVIYEIDDNLLTLDPNSRFASTAPKDYAKKIKDCIKACEFVQCSTSPLAAVISKFHPNVMTLENQLEYAPEFIEKIVGQKVIVGYAAGQDHNLDWAIVQDAYNAVIADLYSLGIQVETWIIGDKAIFDSINSDCKKLIPMMNREEYLRVLSQIDISIMPLKNSAFNKCKSDVKYLESASQGTPVLASRLVYGKTIIDGQTGLLFSDAQEFYAQLTRLITDRSLARHIAVQAHEYVRKNRLIDQHAHRWLSTYQAWRNRGNTKAR